jgi:ribonuclease-3
LTHSSYSYEAKLGSNNERLEFLGDAALEIIISEELFTRYPNLSEGELTRTRASIVCESSLAKSARALNIGEFLFLGKGETQTGGRDRDSILADAMESVIGAIFVDGGFDAAKKFTLYYCANGLDASKPVESDYKTLLQERYQKFSKIPLKYEMIGESGPAHQKNYTVRLTHKGKVLGTGKGRNKKEAQQSAALEALKDIREFKL